MARPRSLLFSMDGNAVMTSHGQIDSMVGKDTIDMTDAAGKSYRRDIELKSTYCIRALPDDIVCVGAYK